MRRTIPLLLLLFLAVFGAQAQSNILVQGQVTTSGSASVSGLLVEISYDSIPQSVFPAPVMTFTNGSGFFSHPVVSVPNAIMKVRLQDCNGSFLVHRQTVLPNVPTITFNFSNFCASAQPACNPAFTAVASPMSPYMFNFTLNQGSVAPTTTLIWSFGDGNSQTTVGFPFTSHTYANAGNYIVTVLMVDSFIGCNAFYSDSVRVWSQGGVNCMATFAAGQFPLPTAANNTRFHINAFSSPAGRLRLDFGDGLMVLGQVGALPFVDHVYATPGVYRPCLYITDSTMQCNRVYCDSIVVSASGPGNCIAAFNMNFTPGIAPLTVQFQNTSLSANGTPFGYSSIWNFGDGTSSTLTHPTHHYTANGMYIVTLSIFDSLFNCSKTTIDSIYIGPSSANCAAIFTYTIAPQPGGGSVTFVPHTNAVGPFQYAWNLGNGQVVNQSNPVAYFANGAYRVCLTMTSLTTGCVATYCDSLVVGQSTSSCRASFVSTVPSGNAPVTVGFANTSMGQGPQSYFHWDFGDGTNGAGYNASHIYTANGTYFVKLSLIDTFQSCFSLFTDTIVVGNVPSSCQSFFTYVPGAPGSRTFNFVNQSTSNAAQGVWYQWNFGDGSPVVLVPNPVHVYSSPGTYQVCLTINTPSCTDTYCSTITIGTSTNFHSLGGIISGPTASIGNSIRVYLFEVQNGGVWVPSDTVNAVDSSGFFSYYFNGLPSSTYAVLAELTPNSPQGQSFFPTYVGNTVNWNNAVLIYLNASTSSIPWNINMVNFLALPTGGGGNISGNVLRGNLRVVSGNLSNVTVQLLDASLNPIRTNRTNAQGQFNFNDLPMGTYNVHIDWPGRTCIPIPVVLSSTQNAIAGINFTMNRGNITTAVQEVFAGVLDKIYPNPVQDQLNIAMNVDANGYYQFELLTLDGKQLVRESRQLVNGEQRIEINTQILKQGLYLLRITDPSGASLNRKVSK